nr:hypothetical protein [Tanacetum cinerariifolium]
FSMIKLVSRHQTTQQFSAMLPIELTNKEIRNSKAYKEYYAIATGEAAPKPKASARRTRGSQDRGSTAEDCTQEKQIADTYFSAWWFCGDEGDGEENQGLNVNKEEEHVEDEEEDELYRDVNINQGRGLQVTQKVEDSHVTLTLINSDGQQESSSVSSQFVTNMLNPTSDAGMESIFATASTSMAFFL